MSVAAHILLLALCGCSSLDAAVDAAASSHASTPIVRASNGGYARMTVIACPRTELGIEAVRELLQQMLTYNGELVVGRSGGSASLTINSCPSGTPITALPSVPISTRRN